MKGTLAAEFDRQGLPADGPGEPDCPPERAYRDAVARLSALWLAVKKYDRIGFEGSELLEEMCETRIWLDQAHGSAHWRS